MFKHEALFLASVGRMAGERGGGVQLGAGLQRSGH